MRPLLLLAVAACTSSGPADITGPYTGPVSRFVVDRFVLPSDTADARALADDLDGNGYPDNQLGAVVASLAQQSDATTHAADMIASGAIASFVEIQAPSLSRAQAASVTFYGADGEAATAMGGTIGTGGVFVSNATRTTRVPGRAIVHLPVFADADPSVLQLDAMEIELVPDGAGGYDATIHGGVPLASVATAMCQGMQQMIYARPDDHYILAGAFDMNRDGTITCDELAASSLIKSLTASDVTLFGEPDVSLGFGVHLAPCETGRCAGAVADPCHDRVQDGGETGVDCGGSCGACVVASPTCSDGVRDGLETDVDCGWNCGGCALGKHCVSATDCVSGADCIDLQFQPPGTCQAHH